MQAHEEHLISFDEQFRDYNLASEFYSIDCAVEQVMSRKNLEITDQFGYICENMEVPEEIKPNIPEKQKDDSWEVIDSDDEKEEDEEKKEALGAALEGEVIETIPKEVEFTTIGKHKKQSIKLRNYILKTGNSSLNMTNTTHHVEANE